MSLQNDGLEIIKFTKVKNRDIDVKESTNYEELIITLQHNSVANVCAENNEIRETVVAKLGINEYNYLQEKHVLSAATDTSNSDDGEDKKHHMLQLYHNTYEDT